MTIKRTNPLVNHVSDIQSEIIFHLNIFKSFLNHKFYEELKNILKKQSDKRVYGFEIDSSCSNLPSLQLGDNIFTGDIPIKVTIKRKKSLKFNCNFIVSIKCIFNLLSDLKLDCQTSVEKVIWQNSSGWKIGNRKFGLNNCFKKLFEKKIIKLVGNIDLMLVRKWESLNIEKLYENYSRHIFLLDEENSIILDSNTEKIVIHPFENDIESCNSKILLKSNANLIEYSGKDNHSIKQFPVISTESFDDDDSRISISGKLSGEHLKVILNKFLVSKTMSREGRVIIIEEILDVCVSKEFQILFKISGDLDAEIRLKAIPVIDIETQEFSFKKLDIDIKTQSLLKNAGLWFFNSLIKKQLNDAFNFIIEEEKASLQKIIDENLKSVSTKLGHDIDLLVYRLHFRRWELADDCILFSLFMDFYLSAKLARN